MSVRDHLFFSCAYSVHESQIEHDPHKKFAQYTDTYYFICLRNPLANSRKTLCFPRSVAFWINFLLTRGKLYDITFLQEKRKFCVCHQRKQSQKFRSSNPSEHQNPCIRIISNNLRAAFYDKFKLLFSSKFMRLFNR